MVELSPERSRLTPAMPQIRKEIPHAESPKPAEVAVSLRPTIAMEKHSPEAIKAKKIAKKPLPALWGGRADFLPETTAFLKGCGIDPERVNPIPMGEGFTNVVFSYAAPDGSDKVIKIARQARKVESASVRAQLVDLARLNREMMRQTGHSLDFIGVPGGFTWLRHQFMQIITKKSEFQLSNIHVDSEGNLKIIDEGLLRFKNVSLKQRLTSYLGFFANRLIMRLYFGVDLMPKPG